MANKVRFGLKNLYIASVTESSGTITYGTPQAWPGSVKLTLDPQGDSSSFYADDCKYFVSNANDGYEVTLETALVPDWFLKDYLGQTTDTNGNLVEQSTDAPKHFAALFEFTGDNKAVRHCLYYCQATRPTQEAETKGESAEVKTEEITFTAMTLPGTDIIKSKTTDQTTATAYNAWYTTVATPTFPSSGNTGNSGSGSGSGGN